MSFIWKVGKGFIFFEGGDLGIIFSGVWVSLVWRFRCVFLRFRSFGVVIVFFGVILWVGRAGGWKFGCWD